MANERFQCDLCALGRDCPEHDTAYFSDEELLVADYEAARKKFDIATAKLDTYFMPRMRAAVRAGDVAEMDSLIERCPVESVTRAFLRDAKREYSWAKDPCNPANKKP